MIWHYRVAAVFCFSDRWFRLVGRSVSCLNFTHRRLNDQGREPFNSSAPNVRSLLLMSPHHLSSSRLLPPLTLLLFHLLPLSHILSAPLCRCSQNSSIEPCTLIHRAPQYWLGYYSAALLWGNQFIIYAFRFWLRPRKKNLTTRYRNRWDVVTLFRLGRETRAFSL